MDLSTRIVRWRESRSMTQAALARAVGVSKAAVSLWESKAASPSHKHLEAVVQALGLTMARFYGRIPARKRAAA